MENELHKCEQCHEPIENGHEYFAYGMRVCETCVIDFDLNNDDDDA